MISEPPSGDHSHEDNGMRGRGCDDDDGICTRVRGETIESSSKHPPPPPPPAPKMTIVNPYAKQRPFKSTIAAALTTTTTTSTTTAPPGDAASDATAARGALPRTDATGIKRPRSPEPHLSPNRVLFRENSLGGSSQGPQQGLRPPPSNKQPLRSGVESSTLQPQPPTTPPRNQSTLLPPRPNAALGRPPTVAATATFHPGRPPAHPSTSASATNNVGGGGGGGDAASLFRSHPLASHSPSATTTAATAAASPSFSVRSSPAASRETLSVSSTSDPRQENLPGALRFDPRSTVPPVDDDRRALIRHAALASTLPNGWTLFSHQKRAILFGIRLRRSILALDMGTGKTIIGCVWAKAFHRTFDCHVVILCPVSLKENWLRTAVEATEMSVETSKVAAPVGIHSWASVPPPTTNRKYVVVADEAHSMQSMSAQRTKLALQLMDHRNCLGALLLTGTPLKNGRPTNLFPLLKAVRHPLAKCQRAYEEYFCQGAYRHVGRGQPVWQANGADHLDQLRGLVASHVLYTSKDDVLKELPKQTRVRRRVPVSAQWQAKHAKALHELAQLVNGSSSSNSSANDPAVLGAIQRLRLVGSLAKIDAAVQVAVETLQKESAVVIFSSFVDVSKAIHGQLKSRGWDGELLTGETPPNKRQGMVDRFQKGEVAVFCCTFGAGGVGLTLTAAATVILVDRPWTPGDVNQAEDRVRRIGQTKPVTSIWISAFDFDDKIDSMLEKKRQDASTVLDDRRAESRTGTTNSACFESMGGKLNIFQMLRGILPNAVGPGPASCTHGRSSQGPLMKQTTLDQFSQGK